MHREIQFDEVTTLPPLAWLAEFVPDTQSMRVTHGTGVETTPQGLVEGAWNGDFDQFDFHRSSVFCGTGFRSEAGRLYFCSSTDRVCPVFSMRRAGTVFVSNSPVFLMTRTGTSPLSSYPYYHYNLMRISRQGLHCMSGTIPLSNGASMQVHFSAVLVIDQGGNTSLRSHPAGPCPDGFDAYHALLLSGLKRVLENARHPNRKTRMESAAALSAGYDSTATAVLAKDAGCGVVHTFYDSRQPDPHADSGVTNARLLGMECVECDRWSYLASDRPVEAEFCFNASNSNATMVAMEDALPGKIYIIGSGGDTYWSDSVSSHTGDLAKPWAKGITGISQLEFRLRVGYQVISPVYIGARHTRALESILTAREMEKWSVRENYDRPLPRRIAEQAGIPREGFAVKKGATGHASLTKEKYYSQAGLGSYRRFKKRMFKRAGRLRTGYYRLSYSLLFFVEYRVLKREQKVVSTTPAQRKYPFLLNSAPFKCPWKFCFTFQWMHDEIKQRYHAACCQPADEN